MALTPIDALQEAYDEHQRMVTVEEVQEHYFSYHPKGLARRLGRQVRAGNVKQTWDRVASEYVYKPL